MQPVDILGYTDAELLDLIEKINELEPYAFSIVDTFGSLYREDLQRVFYLVHHNLWANAKIGFHSHNNLHVKNEDFMKSFSELIKQRRSMRKFTDEELTQEEVAPGLWPPPARPPRRPAAQ